MSRVEEQALDALKDALGYLDRNVRTDETLNLRSSLRESIANMQEKYGRAQEQHGVAVERQNDPLPHPYAPRRQVEPRHILDEA